MNAAIHHAARVAFFLRRMERAQYLLLTSTAPVKEVAGAVGIPDAAYFTRAFARYCGCWPSDYHTSYSIKSSAGG